MPEETLGLGREEVLGHPALTDPRTGLANQLHFELVYRYLFAAGDRGMAFSIMLLSVGDAGQSGEDPERLRTIGGTIHHTTRASDLVAHVGGNRYVVLLLGTNLPGARIAADRIEAAIQTEAFAPISIGLATFNPAMTDSSALLRSAEEALAVAEGKGGSIEMA